MKILPTYQDCLEICRNSQGKFYETLFTVDGYKVSIFNYRLCMWNDFVEHNGFELRGLTFVFNTDGTVYNRFLLLEKFFNLNENPTTLLDLVNHKKIKSIYMKEDGSVVSFIKLPNGKIIAKTKNSFESDQAKESNVIFQENAVINNFVKDCLDRNITPIFEFVSPFNRVVVGYDKTKLILLRLRDNITGQYLNIENDYGIEIPNKFNFSLADLIQLKSKIENIEGWVIEFDDGQKIKIKTDWYFNRHNIYTEQINREDYIIDMVLDEKIDDVLSLVDKESENWKFCRNVINKCQDKYLSYMKEITNILSKSKDLDRKSFVDKYIKHPLFPVMIKNYDEKNMELVLKDFIKAKTYKLSDARRWINS